MTLYWTRWVVTLLLAGMAGLVNAGVTGTPVTWSVVGLDSNNVNTGPNVFPIGFRVCTDAATPPMTVHFTWLSSNAYISMTSPAVLNVPAMTAQECRDVYYDITVLRNSSAYDQAREYSINVFDAADIGLTMSLASTPSPQEVYVEHLISQNRNAIISVSINGFTLPTTGSYNVEVGESYDLVLIAKTATQGYEQLEELLTLPNGLFQVNSISMTYSANSGTDPYAGSKIYADGCGWVSDPTDTISPSYRECIGTGKYGGSTTLRYNITVLPAAANTSQPLNAVIYDFSGSSYHYNSDYDSTFYTLNVGGLPGGNTDLAITKTVDTLEPTTGAPISFFISATNNGSDPATGVEVTDLVPAGYTLKPLGQWTVPVGSVSISGQLVTWTIGNLANGESQTLEMVVQVNGGGPFSNTARISGNELDPNLSNNQASDSIRTTNLGADVAVMKTVDKLVTQVGDTIFFTVSAVNLGPSTATAVSLTDVLPSGYSLVSGTASTGSWDGSVWNVGSLTLNQTEELIVEAIVNASGEYLNTVTADATSDDPNLANNIATANAEPSFLSVSKTATSSFEEGQSGTFNISVTKGGNPAVLGIVTVQDVAPVGMDITSMSGAGWSCNTSECTRADTIGVHSYPTIVVNVKIASPAADELTNYVSASAGASYAEANAKVTVVDTGSAPESDLQVVKEVDNSAPVAGSNITFTVTATNNGPDDATNVFVAETLASGYQMVSSTSSVGIYDGNTWSIGSLGNGASATLVIEAMLLDSGIYENTVIIDGNEHDPIPSNDSSTVTPIPVSVPTTTLTPTAPPASIPTLSAWNLLVLTGLLTLLSASRLGRRAVLM